MVYLLLVIESGVEDSYPVPENCMHSHTNGVGIFWGGLQGMFFIAVPQVTTGTNWQQG